MSQVIGKKGLELVKEFEGCYLEAYKDAVGVWTIGYGHTGKVKGKPISKNMKITNKEAEELLIEDMKEHANYVDSGKFCPIKKLNSNQRDALISFCFNVGPGNLRKLCTGRTIDEIGNHITDFNHAGGKVLNGLTRRRKAEQSLFREKINETEKKDEPKYIYTKTTYRDYDKKVFITDLQVALKCNKVTGKCTEELLNKTITLSTKINYSHKIVRFVQKYLKHEGYLIVTNPENVISKIFDKDTERAVKKFQKKFIKEPDGEITANQTTWKKLLN